MKDFVPPMGRWKTTTVRKFVSDESGSFVVFSLFLLLAMLMISGMAVDFMRTENFRVHLQSTSDRAALAAAHLDQDLDPEVVVASYFEQAGLEQYLNSVTVEDSDNARRVRIDASRVVPSMFLKLVGINELDAVAASSAAHEAQDIEVAVVLDMSSSMWSNNRIQNLRSAMDGFIAEMVPADADPNDPGLITVSLVPYSMTVNPGGALAPSYTISNKHTFSSCMFFENADFETLAIDTEREYEQYSHYQDSSGGYSDDGTVALSYCPTDDTNAVVAHSINPVELGDAVDAMRPWDATSIDVGVKWGLHMLDPSFNPVMRDLAAAGLRDAALQNRPVAYDAPGTKKILILMSDGENDEMRDLWDAFRDQPSPVWIDETPGRLSVLVRDGRDLPGFDPSNDAESYWYSVREDTIDTVPDMVGVGGTGSTTDWTYVAAEMRQLMWPEVFDLAKTNDLAGDFFQTARDAGYISDEDWATYVSPIIERMPDEETVGRLSDICRIAREAGVTIYGIAFDPPSEAASDAILDCASSSAHFFPAEGLEIESAFSAISRQVRDLRLTN